MRKGRYTCVWRSRHGVMSPWEWTADFESAEKALDWATKRYPKSHCVGVFRVSHDTPVGSGKRHMSDGKPQPWSHDPFSRYIKYSI
jgi:hypothetical protein